MQLHVIFRSNPQIQIGADFMVAFDTTRDAIRLRVLRSLLASMELVGKTQLFSGISLTILDDHSHRDHIQQMLGVTHNSPFDPRLIELTATGPDALATVSLELGKSDLSDLVYVVDDFQLHCPQTILQMLQANDFAKRIFGTSPVIIPYNTISSSEDKHLRIPFIAGGCYWVTTPPKPGTMMIERFTLENNYEALTNTALQVTSNSLVGIAPLPALTANLAEGAEPSRYINWLLLWQQSAGSPDILPVHSIHHDHGLPPDSMQTHSIQTLGLPTQSL